MLDSAEQRRMRLTNLALQKLLYFAHGMFLTSFKKPLVRGYFEAWQYGPVHPTVYQAFKAAEDRPIDFRAVGRNPLTGVQLPIPAPTDSAIIKVLDRVLAAFGDMSPGRLVEISHAKGAPWHVVVGRAQSAATLGLRISDDVILSCFKHHKVSVEPEPRIGEPLEDSPLA
jgi:uncharacterized phage-associated protein